MTQVLLALAIITQDAERPSGPLCGQYALEIVVGRHLGSDEIHRVADALTQFKAPYSIGELAKAAAALGLESELVTLSPGQTLACPAILWLTDGSNADGVGHFAASLGQREGEFCMVDPPFLPTLVDEPSLRKSWDGTALLIDVPGGAAIAPIRRERWARFFLLGVGAFLIVVAGRGLFLQRRRVALET
jgi:hypothetical protein